MTNACNVCEEVHIRTEVVENCNRSKLSWIRRQRSLARANSVDGGPTKIVMSYLCDTEENVRKDLARYLSSGSLEDLHITSNNLQTFFNVAKDLKLRPLKNHCENLCLQNLQTKNCLRMMQLAATYACAKLLEQATHMAVTEFETVWSSEDFQTLGKSEVMNLIEHPEVREKSLVLDALHHWTMYEKEFRQDSYQEMVLSLGAGHMLTKTNAHENDNTRELQRYEQTAHVYPVMFTVEDEKCDTKPKAVICDLENKLRCIQKKIRHVSNPGTEFGICCVNISDAPYIFLSGGKGHAARHLLRYDVMLSKWKKCAKMISGRCRHAMAAVNGRVYVLGGYDEGRQLSSIDEYDPDTNTWRNVALLTQSVGSAHCSVYKNRIYILGGKVSDNKRTAAVQCFDPETKTVTMAGKLSCECSVGRAVVFGDYIYVATGQGHTMRYNPTDRSCQLLAPQLLRRKYFGMFTDGKKIYIAGGTNDDGVLYDSFHVYNPDVDCWAETEVTLPEAMCVYGCCSVDYLPYENHWH